MTTPILRFDSSDPHRSADDLAREEPLEIRVRGRPVSITMRSPGHDPELAIGFLLTERVIDKRSDILEITPCDREESGNILNVTLAADVQVDFSRLTRHVFASSSCGLCGKATIDAIRSFSPPIDVKNFIVDAQTLYSLPDKMHQSQADFAKTGGLHAAALFDAAGTMLVVREDVGRHNAVDKVLGWALLNDRLPLSFHILLVSGRLSFEIVQKALAGGLPILAGVSAPSDLAVQFAKENGQTLIGFLRERRMNVYSHPSRIKSDAATLAILAGGEGRRMGHPKANLRIGGRPILQHLLETLKWPGELLLVTTQERRSPPAAELFDRELCDDPPIGPLGGVLTALQNCAADALIVATVDMPAITPGQLQWLLTQLRDHSADAIFVSQAGRLEPFPFVCKREFLPAVEQLLHDGSRAMQDLAQAPGARILPAPSDWPADIWTNLNTPNDLQNYLAQE